LSKETKTRIFYAKGVQHIVLIDKKSPKGAPIQRRHSNGEPVYTKSGEPVNLKVRIPFHYKFKDGEDAYCYLETSDKNIIDELDKKDMDPNNPVITMERYYREKKPIEHELREQNKGLQKENEDLQKKLSDIISGKTQKSD
jgi:hypothetical protein